MVFAGRPKSRTGFPVCCRPVNQGRVEAMNRKQSLGRRSCFVVCVGRRMSCCLAPFSLLLILDPPRLDGPRGFSLVETVLLSSGLPLTRVHGMTLNQRPSS
ncbi:hypothetical protein LY78DRAFT_59800 [Colletotrichum sublineola]|nr:hypothetical protein LY78DRAFT_59800 [Colletotrichum sublineola]